jgi:hypothetical protein
MDRIIIILLLTLILLFIVIFNRKQDNLDVSGTTTLTPISNDALQYIYSVFNNQKILSNNLEIMQNGKINTLTSNQITAEQISTKKLNSNIITSEQITTPKLCFDDTNCLSKSAVSSLLLLSNPINNYMYLPNQCTIWSDLKPHINNEITVIGDSFDMAYDTNKWNRKNIYGMIGRTQKQPNGTGIQIVVPQPPAGSNYDYNVLWIQTINDRWANFKVYNNNPYKTFGKYFTGIRKLNNISPNGATHNESWNLFEWYPVPIQLNADRKIMISNFSSIDGKDTLFSGFAFSTNPWNHLRVSAISIHYQTNKDPESDIDRSNPAILLHSEWNNEALARFVDNTSPSFQIPFVNSGKDKVFYVVEHNNSWGPGVVQSYILNKDYTSYTPLGGLFTTFDNPFSRHFNSKIYQRYYGVIIPANLLPTTNFLTIKLDIPLDNAAGLHFREVGTHDFNPFQI